MIQRGPYRIAAVLDESVCSDPLVIEGHFVDLFDPSLIVYRQVRVKPDENALLFDLDYHPREKGVQLIAASSRVEEIVQNEAGFEMVVKGPEQIRAVARLFCPNEPIEAHLSIGNKRKSIDWEWHRESKTVLLNYVHSAEEVTKVQVIW